MNALPRPARPKVDALDELPSIESCGEVMAPCWQSRCAKKRREYYEQATGPLGGRIR